MSVKKFIKDNRIKQVTLVVYVPESHADAIRAAISQAGGGVLGNYEACSFSIKGISRFTPKAGATPAIGKVGVPQEVIEERIEMVCPYKKLKEIIAIIKKEHPYEEIAFNVYPIISSASSFQRIAA
jgi:hypothetical protein